MLSQPTQAFRRFFYETGRSSAAPSALGPVIIPTANVVESSSLVFSSPGFVTSLEAVAVSAGNLYLLGFDLPANSAILNAITAGSMGAARYSWGPIPALGTLVREFQEMFPGEGAQAALYSGAPFDLGLVVVASSTPVIYTAPAVNDAYKLLVRGSLQIGC